MEATNKKIEDIQSKLEILEIENQMLSERAEDVMLINLLSELSDEYEDYLSLIEKLLERVSMLKDIEFVFCGLRKEQNIIPLASYCQSLDDDCEPRLYVSDYVNEELKSGLVELEYEQIKELEIEGETLLENLGCNEVLIVPFLFQMNTPAIFVFGNNNAGEPNCLSTMVHLLQQLSNLTEDRINKIFLLGQLKKANFELEERVRMRTEELQNKNVELEEEIQKRKNIEVKLIKAKEQAEESDQLKSAFLANMSHEIRTPMNAIMGFSDLLQRESLSEEEKKTYLSILKSKGHELLTLIDDILYLSKIEANQVKLEAQPCELYEYMQLSMHSWTKMLNDSGKKNLKLNVQNNIPARKVYYIDEVRLSQILNNLVSNAIKFTEEGDVSISGWIEKDGLYFKVKDTGVGIPEDKLEVVFERFRQVDGSHTRKFGGTGLGLAICTQLVGLMQGRISVESEEGIGTEFMIKFPVRHKNEEQEVSSDLSEGRELHSLEMHKVLIAEDDYTNYLFLASVLKGKGVHIDHAENGRVAVEMFRENNEYDLILMDLNMPEMNGFEASEQIKKIKGDVPIIGQTAISPDEIRHLDTHSVLDDYVLKPINIDLLFSKINRYLSSVEK